VIKSTTTVCASGRFGNQIFQLCQALYLSKTFQIPVKIDVRGTAPKNLQLLYRSGLTSEHELVSSRLQRMYLRGSKIGDIYDTFVRLRDFLQYFVERRTNFRLSWLKFQKNPTYIPDSDWKIVSDHDGRITGYFQDAALIEVVWEELKIRFNNSNLKMSDFHPNFAASVFLHVRLTDYLAHPEIGVLSEDYYIRALKNFPNNEIFLSTDSHAQFENRFHTLSKQVKEVKTFSDDLEAFRSLCNSKNLIIANSSFSYWAGIFSLMKYENALVIAPNPWRADGKNQSILSSRFLLEPR
jgi:hypothetical protein